jgi:hypothetical protein
MQENKEKNIEEIFSDAKEYLEKRVEYLRLSAVGTVSKIFADIVTNLTVIIFFAMAFILGSITLALFLSDLMGSFSAGFGMVTLIYLLLAVIVFLTKNKYIEKGIVNFMIRKYFNKYAEEEEDEKI